MTVAPPEPSRPRVSRRRYLGRRVAAIAGLVLLAALAFGLVKVAGGGSSAPKPTTVAALPPPKPLRIIFPEGFTRLQMAERVHAVVLIAEHKRHVRPRLSQKTYLAATRPHRLAIPGFGSGTRSLEGFLFPATYDFLKKTTSKQLVKDQLQAFEENWRTVKLGYAHSKNLTPYDVLIVASLVEKEAVVPTERPKIARVIYNRLHARMNLGIDATTRYGLHVPGTRPLTQSELQSTNPYNTRNPNILGLPPTPIANPGLASMRAAAQPAAGNWLYFVRKPDKRHHYFTASYQDFVNHEIAYGYR